MKQFTINTSVAAAANQELHSIRIPWQYLPYTSRFLQETRFTEYLSDIESISKRYGPMVDTQKLTWSIFNSAFSGQLTFSDIRYNTNSFFHKHYPNTLRLINELQSTTQLQDYKIVRVYVNMQMIRPQWSLNAPHADFMRDGMMSVLYYANDSDGDTLFFDKQECVERVTPQMGKAVTYPSKTIHAGSTPTQHETRVVVNMILSPKQ